ncbi:hypothetical protein LAUMK4_03479 [Mycobacterium persicum]|uniref:Uncharacterized protein n=1 Tax=Mycobacterium persicum TaxID=1487726 RepID=A0ABY6RKY4_9MYCO|nr:hypothetical protein LAUMK15_03793 [Mycobacterium persicum]VAZ96357.1 hypothetical protein LAUMK4_03479 [Mycobacterium persicum]
MSRFAHLVATNSLRPLGSSLKAVVGLRLGVGDGNPALVRMGRWLTAPRVR